ncbi:MAG: hypothetical protein Q9167_004755 [Letrouitia subvulpina]
MSSPPPTSGPSRISYLANIISTQTAKVDSYLQSYSHPQPSFAIDAPTQLLPPDANAPHIEEARTATIEASIELQQLLQGPRSLLSPTINVASLHAIVHFSLATLVPRDTAISFEDLAALVPLHKHDVQRIIRHAIAHHRVFCEPEPGFVAHSAASWILAENSGIRDSLGMLFDESWPAYAKTVEALARFPKSEEPNASVSNTRPNSVLGFAVANNTTLPMYAFLAQDPTRAKRFASTMSTASPSSLEFLSSAPIWGTLGPTATVVDVGGSRGHVSAFLAQKFPSLHFIVQDLRSTTAEVEHALPDTLPGDGEGRVKIMEHDFFKPQPMQGADVYLFRFVFHNWSDGYCVKILRALVPAMRSGAKVAVNDHCMPEPGTLGLSSEKRIR